MNCNSGFARNLRGLAMSSNVWEKQKIGEIALINMGQSPESKYYNNERIGLPFLQGNRGV
jgi:hypothetical protein